MTNIVYEPLPSIYRSVVLHSSLLGYVFGLLIISVLLINVIYSYTKLFAKSNSKSKQNKTGYILVITYLTSSFIICIIYCCFRTNALPITGFNLNQFTLWRCTIGVYLGYIVGGINYSFLNFIFLFRIKLIFKDSVYKYKPYVYKSYFIFVILSIWFAVIITVIYCIYDNTFTLQFVKSTQFAFCGSNAVRDLSFLVSVFFAILQLASILGLLFMFVQGLTLLNKQMMLHFLDKYIDDHGEKHVSVDIVMNEYSKQKSMQNQTRITKDAQKILNLHNVIKKQTILVCIATVSTVSLWLCAAVSGALLLEAGWDICLNGICVWLMISSSKIHWNICKKYVCCCCFKKIITLTEKYQMTIKSESVAQSQTQTEMTAKTSTI